jgi:8-oxo-dGTP pyrophosphatase MutT (NUDIX family)
MTAPTIEPQAADAWLDRLSAVLDPVEDRDTDRRSSRSDGDLNGAPICHPAPRDAAVLAALMPGSHGLDLIFTVRAAHLTHHAGQISFPGGRHDPEDDSLAATALREAEEEVGLPRDHVQLLGSFEPYNTLTGFRVRPFVGLVLAPFKPAPQAEEVEDVFFAPFSFFMDRANHRIEAREFRGAMRSYYAMPWQGRPVWGATAGMLRALSDRLGPDFGEIDSCATTSCL